MYITEWDYSKSTASGAKNKEKCKIARKVIVWAGKEKVLLN